MRVNEYRINRHAAQRMAQRNLAVDELALVLRFGRAAHRAGAVFYFLGERDVPEGMGRALDRLVGTTVVAVGERVSTVYRNRRALKRIKRKQKWHRTSASFLHAGHGPRD